MCNYWRTDLIDTKRVGSKDRSGHNELVTVHAHVRLDTVEQTSLIVSKSASDFNKDEGSDARTTGRRTERSAVGVSFSAAVNDPDGRLLIREVSSKLERIVVICKGGGKGTGRSDGRVENIEPVALTSGNSVRNCVLVIVAEVGTIRSGVLVDQLNAVKNRKDGTTETGGGLDSRAKLTGAATGAVRSTFGERARTCLGEVPQSGLLNTGSTAETAAGSFLLAFTRLSVALNGGSGTVSDGARVVSGDVDVVNLILITCSARTVANREILPSATTSSGESFRIERTIVGARGLLVTSAGQASQVDGHLREESVDSSENGVRSGLLRISEGNVGGDGIPDVVPEVDSGVVVTHKHVGRGLTTEVRRTGLVRLPAVEGKSDGGWPRVRG